MSEPGGRGFRRAGPSRAGIGSAGASPSRFRNEISRRIAAISRSPANKIGTVGREAYLQKQRELVSGGVNLVEIDLIRSGPWVLRVPEFRIPSRRRGMYHVCVSRGARPSRFEVYPIQLQDRLPAVRIPLRETDPDAVLDLQALIEQVYENGSYGYDVDYSQPPRPPLAAPLTDWAIERLKAGSDQPSN